MKSIRRQLLWALLGALALALLLGAWATYRAEVQQADALLDYHLRQIALALRDRPFDNVVMPPLSPGDGDFDYSIQVWSMNGVTLYYSYPQHVFPNRAQLGYTSMHTAEGPWRVFAMQSRDEVIQVALPMSRRDQLAAQAASQSLRAFLLLFPLVGVLVWLLVGKALAPIARLAQAIGARSPTALEPVSQQVPAEVQPLVRALNDLLGRLQSALQAQRQFVADAAHELRTPLAALQLQSELLGRAVSPEERSAALAELQQGLSRTTRVVQQLLTLAREEPGAVPVKPQQVALDQLLRSVLDELRPLAAAKRVELRFALGASADCSTMVDEPSLRTLLANLLDNAVRYTPEGGVVQASLLRTPQTLRLSIEDSGAGIPAAERARVFDRFYRREGAGGNGAGLGLAIVQAIAERQRLRVLLGDAALGGLSVTVEFPLPATIPAA